MGFEKTCEFSDSLFRETYDHVLSYSLEKFDAGTVNLSSRSLSRHGPFFIVFFRDLCEHISAGDPAFSH